MTPDEGWFWTSAITREAILRDEVDSLGALSTAFDPYVEVGDVREQLAGYPETASGRQDVVRAIEDLGAGGPPRPSTRGTPATGSPPP